MCEVVRECVSEQAKWKRRPRSKRLLDLKQTILLKAVKAAISA